MSRQTSDGLQLALALQIRQWDWGQTWSRRNTAIGRPVARDSRQTRSSRVLGGGGEQVVAIKAGGEEKPEREEVVEPVEEPTPERHKERREEKVLA